MANEMKESELNEVSGGNALNGKYYYSVPAGWTPYNIKAGDCLSVIAVNRGTTVATLMANNPMISNANTIRAGFWMVVPQK